MSLHTLANHLQSAGRGEDKVLVHMTPGEVNGLQSLAMAHGGSLSINPQTGLPEAGFLKSLLPMAIGFGLAPFTGGMSAALITGAGYTAATGSLKKGIMAGLGAYGGAGLAGGLSAMGASAVAPAQAGLSPAVAANTSTAAANNMFANVGSQPLALTDDILAGVAKTSITSPGQAMAFDPMYMSQTGATSPALNQTVAAATAPPASVVPTPTPPPASDALDDFLNAKYGQGTDTTARRVIDLDEPMMRAYTPPKPAPSFSYNPPPGTTGVSTDSLTGYKYYGPGGDEIGGAFPVQRQMPPIESRIPTPVERGVVRSELYPGAPDPSIARQTYTGSASDYMSQLGRGAKATLSGPEGLKAFYAASEAAAPYSGIAGLASTAMGYYDSQRDKEKGKQSPGLIRPYEFEYNPTGVASEPYSGSAERLYFNPQYTALTPYEAPGPEYAANGGLMGYAVGGPVEQMSAMNSVGMNTGYPMANINTPLYSNPMMQRPEATNVIAPSADAGVGAYTGEERFRSGGATKSPQSSGYKYDYNPKTMKFTQTGGPSKPTGSGFPGMISRLLAQSSKSQTTPNGTVTGGMAQPIMQPQSPAQPLIPNINIPAYQTPEQQLGLGSFYNMMNQQMGSYSGYAAGGNVGGISHLGDYSDGGRLLKGPGDGVSDSIPASIGNRQPARLADGEFVVPARIVSEIGNGSTEAGARKLYAMMDRVQRARRKTTGKGRVAVNTKSEKLLPA